MNTAQLPDISPTGFFNTTNTASQATQNFIAFFNAFFAFVASQVTTFDNLYRLFLSTNYSVVNLARAPFLQILLSQFGIAWFLGSNQQAAALLALISSSWSSSSGENMRRILNVFAASPFNWVYESTPGSSQIAFGYLIPAQTWDAFVIYSTSVSAPATPPNTTYNVRALTAPSGWSVQSANATYLSRGYISSGTNIVWSTPIAVNPQPQILNVATPAALPPSAATGTLAWVQNDSSGDQVSVYFFDGAAWRKTSAPNASGGVASIMSAPLPTAVASPNPASVSYPIFSQNPPPASGPSQGYGVYASLANQILNNNTCGVSVVLTDDGFANVDVIIHCLRRVKPTLTILKLSVTKKTDPTFLQIFDVLDYGEIM